MSYYIRYLSMNEFTKTKDYGDANDVLASTNIEGEMMYRLATLESMVSSPTPPLPRNIDGYHINSPIGNWVQGRYYFDSSSVFKVFPKSEWGDNGWDITDISNFKDQVVTMLDASKGHYPYYWDLYFGPDYASENYNVLIYWGYPWEDGVAGDTETIIVDFYLGNDPGADVVV